MMEKMTVCYPDGVLGTFAASDGAAFPGLVVDGKVCRATPLLGAAGVLSTDTGNMLDILEVWDRAWPVFRNAAAKFGDHTDNAVPLESLRVLAPVSPRQIVCAGANYRDHVIEVLMAQSEHKDVEVRRRQATHIVDHRASHGQPFAFIKPISAVLEPFGELVLPTDCTQADWELELAVVIGRPAWRVRGEAAMEHVAGFTIANDITARDRIVRRDIPSLGLDFIAGKSAPGFLPMGPFIVPADLVPDPRNVTLETVLNGQRMQHESTSNMIFPIARLIEFVSSHMRLLPGDVICTGSPAGNGTHYGRFLKPGDLLEGRISGIGEQAVRCIAETADDGAAMHRPFVPLPEMGKE